MRSLRPLIILPPFAALIATGIYLHSQWNLLPGRFPVHWGATGEPDRWALRNWRGVYGPLLSGAFLDALLIGLAALIIVLTPRTTMQKVTTRALEFLLYPLTLSFILLSLLPLFRTPFWVISVIILLSIAAVVCLSYATIRAHSASKEIAQSRQASLWKAGIFYWNPSDPSILVPKRFGIGYTVNFANKWSWVTLVVLLAVVLVPILFLSHH